MLATAVFLGIWQFGLLDWCMAVMAALVAFHMIVELILIVHYNARVLCKCCVKSKPFLTVHRLKSGVMSKPRGWASDVLVVKRVRLAVGALLFNDSRHL